MKIAYIANARMPTEKAHGLQIMHMCRAFAQVGHDVTLIVPKRRNWIEKSIWEFYGMEPCFKVVQVPVVDFIVWDKWLGNWALWMTSFWFGLNARRVIEDLRPDVVYSRDPFSSAWTPRWVPNIFEAHTFPNRFLWLYRWLWKQCDRIVTVTDGLKKMFVGQGIPETKLRVAADAVDLEAFVVTESKEASRKALGLPLDEFLVVYAGHLYPYKGIPDMMEAAQWLDPRIRVVIVGGRPDDLERTKAMLATFKLTNVLLVGRVPHKEVPRYLHAGDLAVMPYTRESHHVEYYSSPLKLFEYLAAGRAIVSTDLPSVREVLDDTTAVFTPPEDPKALAESINRVSAEPGRIAALEASSSRLAKLYTWKNRAHAVLDAMPKPRVEWKLTFWRKYRLEIQMTLLAFLVRFVYVILNRNQTIAGGDAGLYLSLADRMRGVPTDLPYTPFYQPLYPFLLALIRSVFGTALVWVRLFQGLLSALTVFFMMLIARRWANPYASWITGILGALYVPMILETTILYTETTYTFFLTAGIWAFLVMMDSKRLRDAAVAGVLMGLAGLTREVGFYLVPCLAILAVISERSKAMWKAAAVLVVVTALAYGGYAVRNRIVAEKLPANAWVPMIGKGSEKLLVNPNWQRNVISPSRLYQYPLGVWYFFRFPFRLLDISQGIPVKRMILSGDWRGILADWPEVADKSFLVLFHWFILAMAAVGLARGSLAKSAKRTIVLAVLFAMVTTIIRAAGHDTFETFEPFARYRFPVDPLIIVLAAAGIERLSRKRIS